MLEVKVYIDTCIYKETDQLGLDSISGANVGYPRESGVSGFGA